MPRRIGIFSSIAIFSGGILACTPCWNFTHSRGTAKNTVGRARWMSATKVSRLSAKNTCMPVASRPCSTTMRSATWASGRKLSTRPFWSSGTRFRPDVIDQAKVPKLCITPLGMPVVPEV